MNTATATWDAYWEQMARTGYVSAPDEVWEVLSSRLSLPGLRVLDLATGTGGTAARLAAAGAQVTALDLSLRSLQIARCTAQGCRADLALVCGDVTRAPLADAAFDLIISLGVMHYFRDPAPFLAEVQRLLRPGGWALIEVPQKYSLFTIYKRRRMAQGRWEYGDWETEYSVEALRRLLAGCGLTPVSAYGREYYPYVYYALRHLQRLETRLGRRLLPAGFWRRYEAVWRRLERGWWGLHILRDIGVLTRKEQSPA